MVVGGTSLFGGRGSIIGTLIGALIVGVFRNGLALSGVDVLWQEFTVGCADHHRGRARPVDPEGVGMSPEPAIAQPVRCCRRAVSSSATAASPRSTTPISISIRARSSP